MPIRIADRDNIGVARKADMRRSGADAGEQIVDLSVAQRCDGKAKSCQSVSQCDLRAGIGRCDRGATDQRLGEGQRIEHFLHEATGHGVTVLLAGVRPDFSKGLSHLKFDRWLSKERIFYEEDEIYSATLRAVRYAYALLGKHGESQISTEKELTSTKKELYYLV